MGPAGRAHPVEERRLNSQRGAKALRGIVRAQRGAAPDGLHSTRSQERS